MLDERRNYTVPHFDEWVDLLSLLCSAVLVIFIKWIKADACIFLNHSGVSAYLLFQYIVQLNRLR